MSLTAQILEDSNNLTTDAVPKSPRTRIDDSVNEQCPSHLPVSSEPTTTKNTSPRYSVNSRKNYRNTADGTAKSKKSESIPKTPFANVINISHANGIHIGPNITYNVNTNKPGYEKPRESVIRTKPIDAVLSSSSDVTIDHIKLISTHLGEGWKNVGRGLDYSDGQIHQFYENHRTLGIKEVIYQMLLDWIRNKPEKAKLGTLATVLWESQENDVVRRLAEINHRTN